MKMGVVALLGLLLLLGCTGQGSEAEKTNQTTGSNANQTVQQTGPAGNGQQLPGISQLKGCVPGLSFSYEVTTSTQNSNTKSRMSFATSEGGVVNGKSAVLKTIGLTEVANSDVGAFSKEWDWADDCSCLKRETVVDYMGQKISLNESCPRENQGQVSTPNVSYGGEERVSVPAYSGMAKRYDVTFDNESAIESYWLAPGMKVPVKHLYSAGETQVLEELLQYG